MFQLKLYVPGGFTLWLANINIKITFSVFSEMNLWCDSFDIAVMFNSDSVFEFVKQKLLSCMNFEINYQVGIKHTS